MGIYFKFKEEDRLLKKNFKSTQCEAGCDEAGRGCLAGPVVALEDHVVHVEYLAVYLVDAIVVLEARGAVRVFAGLP